MIALIQRVKNSSVSINARIIAKIDLGLNILLCIEKDDEKKDADKLIAKIPKLKIFKDENNKMSLNIKDIDASILVISQFSLNAVLDKNKPSFHKAMPPKEAKELYLYFIKELSKTTKTKSGEFGASMQVNIANDGPLSFIMNSKEIK